jgi:transposase InsO family protein
LKQRLRVVLETIAGRCRVQEACARLDVGPARFHQLRHDFLQDALDGQLPRPLGRPPRAETDAHIVELEREVAALRVELHAARVREEIALALPQVAEPKKKSVADDGPAAAEDRRAEATHLKHLEAFCHPDERKPAGELPRGPARQRGRRELERMARQTAVDFQHWAVAHGLSLAETAARLRLAPRTLRQWDADLLSTLVRLRGRPLQRSERGPRMEVLQWLETVGPGIGLPSLQAHFSDLARAELQDLLRRYRRVWVQRHMRAIHVLHWQEPGTVWAMDFAKAPVAIDGVYPYLLAVRDLASGQQLLWQPVADTTAATVASELTMLFTIHGAPWVMKSDNGPAFRAGELKQMLGGWGVLPLYSPPGLPSYNGSIEAAIGSLKTRTYYQAARHGRWWWTSADAEAAQRLSNELGRPRGARGATPEEAWEARRRWSQAERPSFQETYRCMEREARTQGGIAMDQVLDHYAQAVLDREAIRRALVAHDLLLFRRRRIPLPIPRKKVAKIM